MYKKSNEATFIAKSFNIIIEWKIHMIRANEIIGGIPYFILDDSTPEDNNDCYVNAHVAGNEVEDGEIEPSVQEEGWDDNDDLEEVSETLL